MEKKKSDRANLELRRGEMFFIALAIVFSLFCGALNWQVNIGDEVEPELIDELIESLDFDKLKKNQDMVVAISATEKFTDNSNVRPVMVPEAVLEQQGRLEEKDETIATEQEEETTEPEPINQTALNDNAEALPVIEELPEFPGGAGAFMKWITANVKYPRSAKERKQKGQVLVSFVVNADGDVESLKIEKFSSSILADEVLRAMRTMPKWKPGRQHGKPCPAKIAVPVNFEL